MKRFFLLFLFFGCFLLEAPAQQLVLRKGVVIDSFPVQDSLARDLKLYLPGDFDPGRTWPVIFVCDHGIRALQTLRAMTEAADKNGYILATTVALQDTLSLTENVLRINASMEKLREYLPLDLNRVYSAGFDIGGQLAALVPSLIRPFRGVLSVASHLTAPELIGAKGSFEFVGIMGRGDYQYTELRAAEEFLDRKKIPNHVLYHGGGHQWPEPPMLDFGMQFLTLMALKKYGPRSDAALVQSSYLDFQQHIDNLVSRGDFLLALDQVEEGLSLYDGLTDTGWLKEKRREIRKNKTYRAQKREFDKILVQEDNLTADYGFYLQEDVNSFNLNNLGWWNHQMKKITEYQQSPKKEEQLLGQRLDGYVNALIDDFIDTYGMGVPDDDGLILLHMLKTITAPLDYGHYLKVISMTAKYGDFGTANFYLEELLKNGYKDADTLYELPHTGLLRISPEFNSLLEEYLGAARYAVEGQ